MVDALGGRFANESESYVDLGHRMLERAEQVGDDFWMVSCSAHGPPGHPPAHVAGLAGADHASEQTARQCVYCRSLTREKAWT